jgi:streptogramin lyase
VRRRAWLAGVALAIAAAAPARAVTITEFPVGGGPRYIHPGPDGNVWFAYDPGIGRIGTDGARFAAIPDARYPVDLVTAPDGTVYWTGDSGNGRRLPNGGVETAALDPVEDGYAIAVNAAGQPRWTSRHFTGSASLCRYIAAFGGPTGCPFFAANSRVTGLALGPDGRLWGAAYEDNRIRRMNAEETAIDLEIALPPPSGPVRIAVGPDGNLWVTMFDGDAIDRIAPAGVRTRFPLPPGAGPNDIVAGPDGALWFTEYRANRIGRMTVGGVVTDEFAIPTPGSLPIGIAAGPDGSIWFTESARGIVGRLRLDPAQPGAPGRGGGGGAVSDRLAPRFLRGPVLAPARFRARRGSTLAFSLSEAAEVTIAVARRRAGRRVGGVCRPPSRRTRSRPRCARYVAMGALRRRARAGENTVAFSGRLNGRPLRPGRYRLAIRARDPAGNRSLTRTVAFTVTG